MLSVDLPMIYYQKIEHLVTLITISSNKYQTKSDLKTKKMSDTQILVVFVFPLNPQWFFSQLMPIQTLGLRMSNINDWQFSF